MLEVLRELYYVSKWKDGAVYKTEYCKDVWVPMESGFEKAPEGYIYAVKGSDYDGPTIRRVKK